MIRVSENIESKKIIVRKILSEALTAAHWDESGKGVMLPPFLKAKKQAEFLKSLPETIKPFFPEVFNILEREIPVPLHLMKEGKNSYKELIYEMSYISGEEISRYIEKHIPSPLVVAKIYQAIYQFLNDHVHSVNRFVVGTETLDTSYFKKIEDRLALCRRTAPVCFCSDLLDSEHIFINGKKYKNLLTLVKDFRRNPDYLAILEPKFHSLVMGDTNTENIKLSDTSPLHEAQKLIDAAAPDDMIEKVLNGITAESLGIKFLDPRAIGFASDGADTRDDAMYDNKPWHNSLGHYDEIHYEHFKLDVNVKAGSSPAVNIDFIQGNPFQRAYRVQDVIEKNMRTEVTENDPGMEYLFKSVMSTVLDLNNQNSQFLKDDPCWIIRFVFIMGTHFAAMPPFHFQSELDGSLNDSYLIQRRPVAIYCEGVKWMNWAWEMLEGSRTEFLGIQSPQLPHLKSSAATGRNVLFNQPERAMESIVSMEN